MKSFFSKFTVDIISTCAFGLEVNSFKNPQNELQMIAAKAMMRGGFKSIVKFMGFRLFPGLMKMNSSAKQLSKLSITVKRVISFGLT
jgi:cytochrome P450 family 9